MKKIIAIILVATLSINSFACTNDINVSKATENTTTTTIEESTAKENTNIATEDKNTSKNDELTSKIKNILQKEVFKELLDGKTISEAIGTELKNMTEEAKKDIAENLPEISLDPSNFSNDEKTYEWIQDTLKKLIKHSIEYGALNQEKLNEYKDQFRIFGITIPEIEIKKEMSENEIEELCLAALDAVDKITNPLVLKLLRIDVNDPESIERLLESFNIELFK